MQFCEHVIYYYVLEQAVSTYNSNADANGSTRLYHINTTMEVKKEIEINAAI